MGQITRSGHRKSRYGCLRCKSRHVKCDEQQPCRNCVRHNVECSLVQSRHSQSLPTLLPKRLSTTSSSSPTSPEKRRTLSPSSSIPSPDWMQSLQLLNHWYTSTCLTLHHDTVTLHLWRTIVPGMAVSHEFLMHGLLAISALHYAHVHPDERAVYIKLSRLHQDRALDFFSSKLVTLCEDNCEAFLVLSIFIFLLSTWSIANPKDRDEPITLGAVIHNFALTQGIKSIVEYPTGKNWNEGPLSPLFEKWDSPPIDPSKPFAKQIAKLETLVDNVDKQDSSSRQLCLDGLDAIKKAYGLNRSSYSGRHRTWMWPIELEKERYDFSECHHPAAIVLLAYCGATVNANEGPAWIWDGWGDSVVQMAQRELSREWQKWLQWPLESIRSGLGVDEVDI